ncbi:phosphoribosyltransferase family protein [Cytobacillus kochii]|uniref:Adenine/guanine phosphoribosyltransferase n=1 Tax=Cytobacillus kochii TaxID=859143 RepID=A0A248TM57_9BACI|nr:phosphoribosyltransferase family protein [Cytobacillus kochii]ASV69293.1 hypothetical protein CKF48_19445 [Cytobacillus kochii]
MNNTTQLISSNSYHMIDVIEPMQVKLNINYNPYHFKFDELFQMAARKNKKRSFLFVSKVLGKHLPISPAKGLATGLLLAESYLKDVEGKKLSSSSPFVDVLKNKQSKFSDTAFIGDQYSPIIIGFAETATALGQAFFQAFKNADYFHTTREDLLNVESIIHFEEEHSHATSHRCYIDANLLQNSREIILVDDEMTTGKTARNIITSLHDKFPRKHYTIVSILDWRNETNKNAFIELEEALDITIRHISLLAGEVEVDGNPVIKEEESVDFYRPSTEMNEIYIEKELPMLFASKYYPTTNQKSPFNTVPYIAESGRFGLDSKVNVLLNSKAEKVATFLDQKRKGKHILCIGTGEFMYLPMKIASLMEGSVKYQSTTRSPIHVHNKPSYGARFGMTFPSPEVEEVVNYIYNIPPETYDEVFIFFERLVDEQVLSKFLQQLKIPSIQVVFLKGVR